MIVMGFEQTSGFFAGASNERIEKPGKAKENESICYVVTQHTGETKTNPTQICSREEKR
jgi:hypothetical protein